MKDKIITQIKHYVDEQHHSDLNAVDTKFGFSVKLYSSVLLRIYTDKKSTYRIEFIKNKELAEYFSNVKIATEKEDVYQIDIDKNEKAIIDSIKKLEEPIEIQANRIISNIRVESFGCCSHYIECSDAKTCVMANMGKGFYKGCQYKQNLEAGKIFYGKNANISKNSN